MFIFFKKKVQLVYKNKILLIFDFNEMIFMMKIYFWLRLYEVQK